MMHPRRLWVLLAAALAVRLVLMPLPDPADFDLSTFWLPWMAYGAEHGLAQLYLNGQPPVNYPPLFLALLVGLGKLYALVVPSFDYTPLQSALIKLPAVLADLAVGVLLYVAVAQILRAAAIARWTADRQTSQVDEELARSAREIASSPMAHVDEEPATSIADLSDSFRIGPLMARFDGELQTVDIDDTLALLAAGLWLFNPAVIYVSSVWGQVDSIHTLWMMAALLAALKQRWGWSGLLFGLALLTKLQAVIIAPLLLLLAWRDGWRAVLRWAGWTTIALVASLLPLWAGGALQPVRSAYFGAIGFYPALSMNAYNPWFVVQVLAPTVLGHRLDDTVTVIGPITLRWLGMGLIAAYGLLVLWLLERRWRLPTGTAAPEAGAALQLGAFFAAGLLVFGFFMLPTEMHERYILPALALLAVPAAFHRQARVAYVLLSVTTLLNLVRVLPFSPGVLRALESIPGDRLLISLAATALFVWWTALYARGQRDFDVPGSSLQAMVVQTNGADGC